MDRKNKNELIDQLRIAGAKFKGSSISCPFCKESNPSGGVYKADDGVWRFKCHSGHNCGFCGDVFDVIAKATGRPVEEVLKQENPPQPKKAEVKTYASIEAIEAMAQGKIEGRYVYTDPVTKKPDLVVIRYRDEEGKKHFWQCSPVPGGGWILKRPSGLLPLYNRIEVAGSETVLVVEGEKCVHCCRSAGHVATTSPMGAGNGHYADWTPLAGKTCYLWPDNDEPGIKHMQEVAEILSHLEPRTKVYRIDPKDTGVEHKQDVVDFVALWPEDANKAIQLMIDGAAAIGGTSEIEALIEDTIAGKRRCVRFPWDKATDLTKALMPQTITLLCGKPGGSKTYALLQMSRRWTKDGIQWAMYELEEDLAYYQNRLMAQLEENADLTDSDWVEAHPEDSRQALKRHSEELEEFKRHLYVAPDKQVDYVQLAKWVEDRAKEGCRIIAIDPVTAVSPEKETYIADAKFLFTIKSIARSSGCSILLVTHPRKGKTIVGLDDMAGGAAFQRFIQTILWLEATEHLRDATIAGSTGRYDTKINRLLHLCKTRNGKGNGQVIGMLWTGTKLAIEEAGPILDLKKDKGWNATDV